jgi:hypothetical protein
MVAKTHCQYCGAELDQGREFVFLVEAQEFDEQVLPWEMVQASPDYLGEPLRVCQDCQASINQNRQDLAERDAWERASVERIWRMLKVLGLLLMLFIIGCLIADLLRR